MVRKTVRKGGVKRLNHNPLTPKPKNSGVTRALERALGYERAVAGFILGKPYPFKALEKMFSKNLPPEYKKIISRYSLEPFLSHSRETLIGIDKRLAELISERNDLIKRRAPKEQIERVKYLINLNRQMRSGVIQQVAMELHTIFTQIKKEFHPILK
jgi:hypothetical protein